MFSFKFKRIRTKRKPKFTMERDDDVGDVGVSGLNREVKCCFRFSFSSFSSQFFLMAPTTMKNETITLSAIFIH